MSGGCTPEANKTFSDVNFDEMDLRLADMSGTYFVENDVDTSFTTISLYQTGGSLQGYDNLRRTWNGSMSGGDPVVVIPTTAQLNAGQINLQTSDGPQAILAGNAGFYTDLVGNKYKAFTGVYYVGGASGSFIAIGPGVPAEEPTT
jgi:hypothetical protein